MHRDAFTTSSDFIISPHAAAKGLYIATGGNFHGFKFFPVLGKYIVDMMEGGLSPELANKWAWDRQWPDPCLFADYPRHEMNDFDDPVRTSRL
jgi:glycine/D-amino acid oxidase-like deaminating enzyme